MTNKQNQVLIYLKSVDQATLDEIYKNVSFGYYDNWQKHLGTIMKRLIDTNKVERVKKGVFKIKTHYTQSNEPTLF